MKDFQYSGIFIIIKINFLRINLYVTIIVTTLHNCVKSSIVVQLSFPVDMEHIMQVMSDSS
jgi:hypothetical protein